MTTRFVLLSTQRSGSTWVMDTLNSHPQIASHGELFLEEGQGIPPWGAQDVVFWDTYLAENKSCEFGQGKPELISRYLDALYSFRPGIAAIGFKLMYGQAGAYPELLDYMVSHKISIIHLIRRNYLDTLLSKNAAAARDVYHVRSGEDVPKIKMRLNVVRLIERLTQQERETQKARDKFSRLRLPYLEAFYEDLVSGETSFDVLLDFLAVEPGEYALGSQLRKLLTDPHREIIENYESVRNALEGTRFQNMLR